MSRGGDTSSRRAYIYEASCERWTLVDSVVDVYGRCEVPKLR